MSHRLKSFLILLFLIPCGLATKVYRGPFDATIQASGGGLFYTMFVFFCLRLGLPHQSRQKTALVSILLSIAVECLQLWQPPFLQSVRYTTVGALILGRSFSWSDWPPYVLGGMLAWLLAQSLKL